MGEKLRILDLDKNRFGYQFYRGQINPLPHYYFSGHYVFVDMFDM